MSDYTGPGIYLLQSVTAPNLAASLSDSNKADGTNVVGWDATQGADNNLWQIADAGNGEYLVLSIATGTYMCTSAQAKDVDPVVCNLISPREKIARWNIVPAPDRAGAYVLYSVVNSKMCLNLKGGVKDNGTQLISYTYMEGKTNSQWNIKLAPQ